MPLKILLVDDEEDILWGLSEELNRHGWEILTANSGTEALQILQSTKDLDFLVTDVRMPDISGIDLLLKARELQPQIRAVVMTAHGNEELRNEAFQRGAISYLEKPFDFDQLLAVIQEMGEEPAETGQEWNLMDILQLVAMEGRSARFSVKTPEGPGVLWIKEGELWFAKLGNHEGEEAFFHILRHENVEFQIEWVDTVKVMERNVTQPLYALLLEVVRMRNEARTEDMGRLESELLGGGVESKEEVVEAEIPSLEDISLESLGEIPSETEAQEEEEIPSLDEISLEALDQEPPTQEESPTEIPDIETPEITAQEEESPEDIGSFSVEEVMAQEEEEIPSLDEISLEALDQELPTQEESLTEIPNIETPEIMAQEEESPEGIGSFSVEEVMAQEEEEIPSLDEISLEALDQEPPTQEESPTEIPNIETPEITAQEEESPEDIGSFSVEEVMAQEEEEIPSLDEISLEALDQEPPTQEESPTEIPNIETPEITAQEEEAEIEELEEIPDLSQEESRVLEEVKEFKPEQPESPVEISPAVEETIQAILDEEKELEEDQKGQKGGVEIEEAPPYVAQEESVHHVEPPPSPAPPETLSKETPEKSSIPPTPPKEVPLPPSPTSIPEVPTPTLPENQASALKNLMKRFAKSTGVTGIHVLVNHQGGIAIGAVKGEDLRHVFQQWIQDIFRLIHTGEMGGLEDLALTTEKYHLLGAQIGEWVYVAMFPRGGVNIGIARVRFQGIVKEMRKVVH